jgi:hypothetical protein
MVNKDQLEQSSEGHQVLALMAKHFSEEQFQPALTLIEQLYTEDQTVWDGDLNNDSKLPFIRTTPAHRLLVFFEHPNHLAKVKKELDQRQLEARVAPAEAPVIRSSSTAQPKRKGSQSRESAQKTRNRQKSAPKAAKKKPSGRRQANSSKKRGKQKRLPAKARRSPGGKSRKSLSIQSSRKKRTLTKSPKRKRRV